MAVRSFWEVAGSGDVDDKGIRTYTRKFGVEMEYATDTPPSVWGTGFASISRYDPHPNDAEALAVSLSCSPTDKVLFYEVEIKYTSKPFDFGNTKQDPTQTDQSTSPPSRPIVVTFGATHGTRLLTKDVITGNPIANSAGQPFDPPPEVPSSNMTINITCFKDLTTFDPVFKLVTYQDTINNAATLFLLTPATTTVFPARTLRCNEYKFSSHSENGEYYWQLDVTLEFKWNGWNPISLLDCGTMYMKSMALPLQPVLDAQGNPVTSPVPFDGSGHPLNAGDALVYRNFSGYVETNFANLLV